MQYLRTTSMALGRISATVLSSVSLAAIVGASPGEWQKGDVFLEFVDVNAYSQFQVYDNDGVFKETLANLSTYIGFGANAAFGGPGDDLYHATSEEDIGTGGRVHVLSLDDVDPHARTHDFDISSITGQGVFDATSMLFDAAGNFYVASGAFWGTGDVYKFSPTGVHLDTYDIPIGASEGARSIQLAPDQRTLFYSVGVIKRYDLVTETALADFSVGGATIDFRLLPPFDGSGGAIATFGTVIHRYNASGVSIQTYDLPGYNQWNRVSLDPNGTSFWTFSKDSTFPFEMFRIDIATGAIEIGPIAVSHPFGDGPFGLIVRGEPLGGTTPAQFDAPTPCETTVMATAGVPVSFTVQASDINDGDIVDVTSSALPAGATLTPGLPSSGNPVNVTFDWTPSGTQVGTHLITFTATDFVGHVTTCTATVTVEGPGEPYCFGDGLDPIVTAQCPCTNFGAPGHGCANSGFANGAQLSATGTKSPNTILFLMTEVPNNTLAVGFRNISNTNPGGVVFGDGVRCQSGTLIRFSAHNTGSLGDAPNTWSSPTDTITPGLTRYYQVQYRNPAPAFCPPATFNISNGYRISW